MGIEDGNDKTTVVKYCGSGGIGFVGLLQIAFIVLKLCKVIIWRWWIVFLPMIISTGLTILLLVLAILCACILSDN